MCSKPWDRDRFLFPWQRRIKTWISSLFQAATATECQVQLGHWLDIPGHLLLEEWMNRELWVEFPGHRITHHCFCYTLFTLELFFNGQVGEIPISLGRHISFLQVFVWTGVKVARKWNCVCRLSYSWLWCPCIQLVIWRRPVISLAWIWVQLSSLLFKKNQALCWI